MTLIKLLIGDDIQVVTGSNPHTIKKFKKKIQKIFNSTRKKNIKISNKNYKTVLIRTK